MNRTWWKHLQTTAPIALAACTSRFANKFPRDWRVRIQDPAHLEQYFYEMYKLEVHHAKVSGGVRPHGYRITGRSWKVSRSRLYGTADEARWGGLATAFAFIEIDERRVTYAKKTLHQPVRRQPKDEKKELPQEDWRPPNKVSVKRMPSL